MNRYTQIILDIDAQIENLTGRIARFTARGVRLDRIPAIRAEVATLEVSRKKAVANAKWARELGWVE